MAAMLLGIIVSLIVLAIGLAVVLVWLLRRIERLQAGLVTVCAWTKQVQHQGEWMSAEEYLGRRFGIKSTHGMSKKAAADFLAEAKRSNPSD